MAKTRFTADAWGRPTIMDPKWYVLFCDARRDVQVERLVAHVGIETFNPRIPKTRKRNGDKALFPGYIFTRLDLSPDVWSSIRYLPGVRSLVETGGGPCPVDEGIVEHIRQRVAAYVPAGMQLRPGDRVTVTSGAFADLEGIFCETLSGAERIAILIDMMRRQIRVELPAEDVEAIVGGGQAA